MKIIYHCYGGAHSSVTAAAIHLGWLPTDRIPEPEELNKIPYFDRPVSKDHGNIRFMGNDEFDNEIYVVGRRNACKVFENAGNGLKKIFKIPDDQMVFINVMPYINWKMVMGGFTSRKMGVTWFGRPIIIRGVRHSYWKLVSLVHKTKVILVK